MAKLSKEREAWRGMIKRCYNPKCQDFPRYGGSGITVFPAWCQSYETFLLDVGAAPSTGHILGRRNVSEGYYPDNVIWTTHAEQQRRRKFCRRVTLHGQVMTAAEAARLPGQPCRKSVLKRHKNGLLFDDPPSDRMDPRATWLTHAGLTLPLYEWAKRLGLSRQALRHRIQSGWPIDLALSPERSKGRRPSSAPGLAHEGQAAKARNNPTHQGETR